MAKRKKRRKHASRHVTSVAQTATRGFPRKKRGIAHGFRKIRSVATGKELMGTKRKSMVGLHVPSHAVLAWKLADLRLKRSWYKQPDLSGNHCKLFFRVVRSRFYPVGCASSCRD